MFANVGALLGPLLGSVLVVIGFATSAVVAAVVFALLTLAQLAVLPPREVPRARNSVLTDWRGVLADRRFLAFTLALTGMFALQNQLYLLLPMEASRAGGSGGAVAAVFLVSTVASLLLQVRITRYFQRTWSRGRSIAAGMALMGLAFTGTAAGSVLQGLLDAGVRLHVDDDAAELAGGLSDQVVAAQSDDWDSESLALDMSVRVVDSMDQALDHIRTYSTGHTELIITNDLAKADAFVSEVDSATVMVNASTRFTDGGELGLGAEVGISTQKLHARGPMGLAQLTSSQWVVRGQGHTRG